MHNQQHLSEFSQHVFAQKEKSNDHFVVICDVTQKIMSIYMEGHIFMDVIFEKI